MDEIIIVEHNPNWKLFFEREVIQICKVLDTNLDELVLKLPDIARS